MLFIAAGAFHVSKPSDMIPELQGRFPIRVELNSLGKDDLRRILVEPRNSLVKQYKALLATEGLTLEFKNEAYERLVEIAYEINSLVEDIGARRLHTIMEYLLEEISFNAPDMKGTSFTITREYVDLRLASITRNSDLTKYIL
jgi:ATP-dependent HslUV protease ATP-binding subunit HslU